MSLSNLAGPMRDRLVPLQDFPDLEHLLREKVDTIARLDPRVCYAMKKVLQEIKETKTLELQEWELYTTVEFNDMILGKDAPSDKSILALPDAFKFGQEFLSKCFVVYSGLWTLDGWGPRVYFGSATSFQEGSWQRIRNYELGYSSVFSKYCWSSEQQGFQLSHLGVALIAIPQTRVAYLRGWIIALEAATTLHLGGLYMSPEVYKANPMSQFCPWDIDDIGYKGLCSHNSMSEKILGLEMTDQEVSEMVATKKQRDQQNNNARAEWDSIVLQGKELRELDSSDTDYQKSKRRVGLRKTSRRNWEERANEDRRRIREGEVEKSDPSVAKTVLMDLNRKNQIPRSVALTSEAQALNKRRKAGEELTISDPKVLNRMRSQENQRVARITTYAQDTALLERYDSQPGQLTEIEFEEAQQIKEYRQVIADKTAARGKARTSLLKRYNSQPGQLTEIEVEKAQHIKKKRQASEDKAATLYKANSELVKRWRSEPEKLSDADVQRAEKIQAARQKQYDAKKKKYRAKKRKRSAYVSESDSDVGDNKENEYDDGDETEDDQFNDDA